MQTNNRTVISNHVNEGQACELRRFRLPEQPRAPDDSTEVGIQSTEELRAFFNRHADQLTRKARLFCYGNDERAEEVVQELYPRLLVMLERSPDGLRSPWAAVHSVASRLAIDSYRRATTRGVFKQLAEPESVVDSRKHTVDVQDFEVIHKAIDSLPKRLKEIVLGIFIEGCKAKDIAKRINLSESRLAELRHHALDTLRTLLERDFG